MNAASPAQLIRCSIVTGITSRARGVCPVFATEQHQPPSLPDACPRSDRFRCGGAKANSCYRPSSTVFSVFQK